MRRTNRWVRNYLRKYYNKFMEPTCLSNGTFITKCNDGRFTTLVVNAHNTDQIPR